MEKDLGFIKDMNFVQNLLFLNIPTGLFFIIYLLKFYLFKDDDIKISEMLENHSRKN